MDKDNQIESKRRSLKVIGTAWVTPTILSASIPAHAQTTGAFCGGMEGVKGYWFFKSDEDETWFDLNSDGSAYRLSDSKAGKWTIDGTEFRLTNFDESREPYYVATLESDCYRMTGKSFEFEAHKSDDPPPAPA